MNEFHSPSLRRAMTDKFGVKTVDQYFAEKFRNEAEAIFAARKDKPEFIDYEFVHYKGTSLHCLHQAKKTTHY